MLPLWLPNFAKWINVEPMSGQGALDISLKRNRNLLGENSNYTRAKDRRGGEEEKEEKEEEMEQEEGHRGEAAPADEVCTSFIPSARECI